MSLIYLESRVSLTFYHFLIIIRVSRIENVLKLSTSRIGGHKDACEGLGAVVEPEFRRNQYLIVG